MLQEIIELEYPGEPMKKVVLFRYECFDPTPRQGTCVLHPEHKIIEVRKKVNIERRQVYYVPYLGVVRGKFNWFAVIKTKARARIELENSLEVVYRNDIVWSVNTINYDKFQEPLRDQSSPYDDVTPRELSNYEFINDEDEDEEDALKNTEDNDDKEVESFSSYSE
ncbi:hypothetical protein CDL12_10062 [Handroanthus impetiginosus]|uniref:DUF4216 domain-containing protein n=1 Tax=Handroanthus impetiginosus TaxID=429701 RepID=A0A2G9HIF0_9LAMI|nr:hypothetical protein CDL12_10062 [Handroanthus impetiginosus]